MPGRLECAHAVHNASSIHHSGGARSAKYVIAVSYLPFSIHCDQKRLTLSEEISILHSDRILLTCFMVDGKCFQKVTFLLGCT